MKYWPEQGAPNPLGRNHCVDHLPDNLLALGSGVDTLDVYRSIVQFQVLHTTSGFIGLVFEKNSHLVAKEAGILVSKHVGNLPLIRQHVGVAEVGNMESHDAEVQMTTRLAELHNLIIRYSLVLLRERLSLTLLAGGIEPGGLSAEKTLI